MNFKKKDEAVLKPFRAPNFKKNSKENRPQNKSTITEYNLQSILQNKGKEENKFKPSVGKSKSSLSPGSCSFSFSSDSDNEFGIPDSKISNKKLPDSKIHENIFLDRTNKPLGMNNEKVKKVFKDSSKPVKKMSPNPLPDSLKFYKIPKISKKASIEDQQTFEDCLLKKSKKDIDESSSMVDKVLRLAAQRKSEKLKQAIGNEEISSGKAKKEIIEKRDNEDKTPEKVEKDISEKKVNVVSENGYKRDSNQALQKILDTKAKLNELKILNLKKFDQKIDSREPIPKEVEKPDTISVESSPVVSKKIAPIFNVKKIPITSSCDVDDEDSNEAQNDKKARKDYTSIALNPVTEKEIENIRKLGKLTEKHIEYMILRDTNYFLDIYSGNCEHSWRNIEYKKFSKKSGDLLYSYAVGMGSYTHEQIMAAVEALRDIFCRKNNKLDEYIVKVALPEALIKICMRVYQCSKLAAEEYLKELNLDKKEESFPKDSAAYGSN